MPKLRNIALTVQELEDGEFYWVLMEATDYAMEEALPYLPLEAAQDPYSSYGDALVAGLAMIRKLFGKKARVFEEAMRRSMRESMRKIQWLFAAAVIGFCVVAWFYRPTNSADWAAWVQAFGVLVAIGWGLRMQANAARQSGRQAGQVAALFASNMHWVFRELSDACSKQAWSDFVVHRCILQEILLQGREVSLQLLDGRSLAMVSSLRAIAVEALEVTEPHSESSNWRPLNIYFDKRLPSIAAWLSATGNPPESSGPTDYAGLRTSFGQLGNP